MVVISDEQSVDGYPRYASWLVREESQEYTRHDQLFKQLIENFFEEFLEAFFPDIHEQIDFKKITFLSEELFTEVFDGDKQVLDLVVEVKWKETDSIVVVHIEPQSYQQTNFNIRMFNYFSSLYQKLGKPIIPIALFSYKESWDKSDFSMRFGDLEVLSFQYLTLHLRKQNWRQYMKKNNPVSAALLSKMGYDNDERVKVKLEFMQILTRLRLDREKTNLLLGFFETYLKFSEEEEEIFVKEAKKLENADEILELPISYEERGKKIGRVEGRQEGRREGKQEGRQEVALNLLRKGLDEQLIVETTELSLQEVVRLKKELANE